MKLLEFWILCFCCKESLYYLSLVILSCSFGSVWVCRWLNKIFSSFFHTS
uniref:Uncharacterized protein n=1 Tax=Sus scrofa TaxID=9823 RepID=A0A4X1TXP5_PIG